MKTASRCPLDTYTVKLWNVQNGEKYFILDRNEERTVSFAYPKIESECCVCYANKGFKLPCGHFVCPNDILSNAWSQIKLKKYEISCPSCTSIMSVTDIINCGLPNEDEKQFLITAISVNFCESQDIKQCPNCCSYCQRIDSNNIKVLCIVCSQSVGKNFEFCWYCLKEWDNNDNQNCGNPECGKFGIQKVFEELRNSPKKWFRDSNGKAILSPSIRACPLCFTLLEHTQDCNEMTCKMCGERFCFLCLSKASDGIRFCMGRTYTKLNCTSAPLQNKFKTDYAHLGQSNNVFNSSGNLNTANQYIGNYTNTDSASFLKKRNQDYWSKNKVRAQARTSISILDTKDSIEQEFSTIFVLGFEGGTKSILIAKSEIPDYTVLDLKNDLFKKTEVIPEQQVLKYIGKVLEVKKNGIKMKLSDYNIGSGSTIMFGKYFDTNTHSRSDQHPCHSEFRRSTGAYFNNNIDSYRSTNTNVLSNTRNQDTSSFIFPNHDTNVNRTSGLNNLDLRPTTTNLVFNSNCRSTSNNSRLDDNSNGDSCCLCFSCCIQ